MAASPRTRSGYKFVDATYGSLLKHETDAPYAPGKTRRLSDAEASVFRIRDGPALHFCEDARDCLLYLAEDVLQLGQSVLDDDFSGRLLRVTVPDGAAIQRVTGQYGRKCAATALRVDSEVTDKRELAELMAGSRVLVLPHGPFVQEVWECRFLDGRYDTLTRTDDAGNVKLYATAKATVWGAYRYIYGTSADPLTALKCWNGGKITFLMNGMVVRTYTADELRSEVDANVAKNRSILAEVHNVLYE